MQIDYRAITPRRAQILSEISRHRTQQQIAESLQISPKTVRSHVDWLRQLTGLLSMRQIGDWWQDARRAWLCEMAVASGLRVGSEVELDGNGGAPIKMGPMGGLTVGKRDETLVAVDTSTEGRTLGS